MVDHQNPPKESKRRSLARMVQKEMRAKKITVKELLKALKVERRRYRKEL